MQDILKVAMPKGRIYKQASRLFREAGLMIPDDMDDSRRLMLPVPEAGMEFIMANGRYHTCLLDKGASYEQEA